MVVFFARGVRRERIQTVSARNDPGSSRGPRERRVDYFLCDFTADCSHRERTEKRGRADGVEVEDADIESQSVRRVAGDEILVRVSESARKHAVGVIQAKKVGDRGGTRIGNAFVRGESVRWEEHGSVVETEAQKCETNDAHLASVARWSTGTRKREEVRNEVEDVKLPEDRMVAAKRELFEEVFVEYEK